MVKDKKKYDQFKLDFCSQFPGAEIHFENQINEAEELSQFDLNESFAVPPENSLSAAESAASSNLQR